MGGAAGVGFRRRAFLWEMALPSARDSSAVALYSVGWAALGGGAAGGASSGQWLVVQPTAAVLLAVGAPLGGVLGARSWRGVALRLDTADGVAPCVRGVQSAVRLSLIHI